MGFHIIRMPDVGEGVAEAEIVTWLVAPGDAVREDQILAEVMTDKATVEIPSPVEGTVVSLAFEVGDMVATGTEIIRLEVQGEGNLGAEEPAPAAAAPQSEPAPQPQSAPEPPADQAAARQTIPAPVREAAAVPATAQGGVPRAEGERPIAAPAVRRRARDMGIDLAFVRGSGPAGRILHEDLDAYASGAARPVSVGRGGLMANTTVQDIKVIGLRRRIAEKMQLAKQRIPHISYIEEIDVTEVEALRAQLNEQRSDDRPKLTFLPFLMRAMVIAVGDHPLMSARFDDEAGVIHRYGGVHIGIATQTDNGLVVPVARHAEALDLWASAGEIRRLADAARTGRIAREDLTGSTITITSLGPMGGLATTPVINHPEVAIIGVNKMRVQPVYQNGAFVPRTIMHLSSSFDHRVIDGWDAASFIQRIKGLIEHPATLFMEA